MPLSQAGGRAYARIAIWCSAACSQQPAHQRRGRVGAGYGRQGAGFGYRRWQGPRGRSRHRPPGWSTSMSPWPVHPQGKAAAFGSTLSGILTCNAGNRVFQRGREMIREPRSRAM